MSLVDRVAAAMYIAPDPADPDALLEPWPPLDPDDLAWWTTRAQAAVRVIQSPREPSEAQVNYALAALRKVHYRAWREITPDAMRSALRAASAVTEQGENR